MAKIPIYTNQQESYPGKMPDILPHRASVVSVGIQRILSAVPAESVPVAEESQVLDAGMTTDEKRERLQNMKTFIPDAATMPQDVYIAALASDTESKTTVSSEVPNADLLGRAQAALNDIYGTGSYK